MNGKDRTQTNDRQAVVEGLTARFPGSGNSGGSSQSFSTEPDRECHPAREEIPSFTVRQEDLGEPLAIEQVADLLGCSAWTVRQRYLRQGLPHLQARPRGKLVFFREQVIAWTLKRQRQKGGILR